MNMKILLTFVIFLAAPIQGFAESSNVGDLIQRLGIRESDVASRDMPGWSRPSLITVLLYQDLPTSGMGSADWYREAVDGVTIDFIHSRERGDFSQLSDSDVFVGWCIPAAIEAGEHLDYIHVIWAGVESCTSIPLITERGLIVTNSAKAASETIAEHSIALMLALSRNLHAHHSAQLKSDWRRDNPDTPPAMSVSGKTMLVLGLGGIGRQVARRAHDLGMRVIGTRNSSRNGPDYVDYVGLSDEMTKLAGEAHVVVNALPLTQLTRGIVNAGFFDGMTNGSYYISVGRGATTDTDALMAALNSGKLSGAGLDVTNPEPLPKDHELWTMPNVLITPHAASSSELSEHNTIIIARENLRRYVHGERLLNLVDLSRGY
jgi:phosphoglycerate dehydrogenase-like enzyme